jgi:hypothetical protein
MSEILEGEDIVQARIRGESVRSIAKRLCCTLAEVHKVLDRFAETVIDDKTRKHSLALELERLDHSNRSSEPVAKRRNVHIVGTCQTFTWHACSHTD